MSLPFSPGDFLAVFASYNRAWWAAAIVLWLASLGVLLRLMRGHGEAGREMSLLLAVQWAWAGGVYHLGYFRAVNPAALAFGGLFLLQATLLAVQGVLRPALRFTAPRSAWGWAGIAVMTYALVYPGLGLALGMRYPELPTFGVPCPTTLYSAGAVLLLPRPAARPVAVVPIVWSLIGGSAAFVLEVRADFALLVAGGALAGYILSGDRQKRVAGA